MNVGNRTAERRRTAKRLCVTRLLVESFVVIFNNNDRTSFSSRVSHQIVQRNRRIFRRCHVLADFFAVIA